MNADNGTSRIKYQFLKAGCFSISGLICDNCLAIFVHQHHYLRTVVILRVVDEDSALSLHVASLEVVDHPETVVEQTLVVEVEVVRECLTVVASSVGIGGISLAVCPHVGKSGGQMIK